MTSDDLASFESPEPDHRIAYGEDALQFGELRLPKGAGPHPVAILIHGGWKKGKALFYNLLSALTFLVGGIVALWVTGEYLSVPASVGFIALLGIAVLNGVVLVSYFNQLKSEGMRLSEVVVQGAKRRLRPVLMTASITAFGLIPLLFATGPGSEIQRPLAIVVIGGLITATVLTLMLLPILYLRFAFPKREASHV